MNFASDNQNARQAKISYNNGEAINQGTMIEQDQEVQALEEEEVAVAVAEADEGVEEVAALVR